MKTTTKKAFTMIEVIIWVFIFSLWLVWVFLLFWESVKLDRKSRNIIIATSLAREQIELVKNIRDSNFKYNRKFNWIPNINNKYDEENFFTWWIYKIENNFNSDASLPIKVTKLNNLNEIQLCLDDKKRYIYNSSCENNKKTDFYRYLKFEDAEYENSWTKKIPKTYRVISVVKWKKAGGWKIEIPFILADWKKL